MAHDNVYRYSRVWLPSEESGRLLSIQRNRFLQDLAEGVSEIDLPPQVYYPPLFAYEVKNEDDLYGVHTIDVSHKKSGPTKDYYFKLLVCFFLMHMYITAGQFATFGADVFTLCAYLFLFYLVASGYMRLKPGLLGILDYKQVYRMSARALLGTFIVFMICRFREVYSVSESVSVTFGYAYYATWLNQTHPSIVNMTHYDAYQRKEQMTELGSLLVLLPVLIFLLPHLDHEKDLIGPADEKQIMRYKRSMYAKWVMEVLDKLHMSDTDARNYAFLLSQELGATPSIQTVTGILHMATKYDTQATYLGDSVKRFTNPRLVKKFVDEDGVEHETEVIKLSPDTIGLDPYAMFQEETEALAFRHRDDVVIGYIAPLLLAGARSYGISN